MSVNLVKGGTTNLTKEAGSAGLKNVSVGLGWDAATEGKAIDLDAAILILGADGKVSDPKQFVFFNNTESKDGSAVHSGDNRTGDGDGDDETIKIDLSKVTGDKIEVLVWSYEGQSFDEVKGLSARVVNDADGAELAKFDAVDLGSVTGNLIARFEKQADEWHFTAVGEPNADWKALIASRGV